MPHTNKSEWRDVSNRATYASRQWEVNPTTASKLASRRSILKNFGKINIWKSPWKDARRKSKSSRRSSRANRKRWATANLEKVIPGGQRQTGWRSSNLGEKWSPQQSQAKTAHTSRDYPKTFITRIRGVRKSI